MKGEQGRPRTGSPARRSTKRATPQAPNNDQAASAVRPRGERHEETIDPSTGLAAEVRAVQPYRAAKDYLCPGCNQAIPARTGHVVVVPVEAPDLRRHWHTACWGREARRAAHRRARPTSGGRP